MHAQVLGSTLAHTHTHTHYTHTSHTQVLGSACDSYRSTCVPVQLGLAEVDTHLQQTEGGSQGGMHPRLQELKKWVQNYIYKMYVYICEFKNVC